MANNRWVIDALEKEYTFFDNDLRTLLSWQTSGLKAVCDLLREDAVSMGKRSKQRRSELTRIRTLFKDIYTALGPEVFLLCCSAAPISKWTSVISKETIPELRSWWHCKELPAGLTYAATQACQSQEVQNLVALSHNGHNTHPPTKTNDIRHTQTYVQTSASDEPSSALLALANQMTEPLPGKVYNLTEHDVKSAIMDKCRMWLTIPFDTESSAFITITTSDKLSKQFSQRRPRMV